MSDLTLGGEIDPDSGTVRVNDFWRPVVKEALLENDPPGQRTQALAMDLDSRPPEQRTKARAMDSDNGLLGQRTKALTMDPDKPSSGQRTKARTRGLDKHPPGQRTKALAVDPEQRTKAPEKDNSYLEQRTKALGRGNPLTCAATKRSSEEVVGDTVAEFVQGMIKTTTEERHKLATGNPHPKRAKTSHDARERPLEEPEPPKSGNLPITEMYLRWGPGDNQKEHTARILLDTGASVPILDSAWAKLHGVPLIERQKPKAIEDFAGDEVKGAGIHYTARLELQHRRHYVLQAFEIAPLGKDFDALLPAWWTECHKASNMVSDKIDQLRFDSDYCKKHCTKDSCREFPLEWDEDVLTDPEAQILGMVCAAPTESELKEALDRVPDRFKDFLPIMTSEAAEVLPQHGPYDHAIDLKDGTTPPWGPIYALNEMELEELRKWLKRMTEMGAVRPSKSSCSSPMLFVPKGHGRGLRLCIDYRGINRITIPNRYPLPNMDELKDRVRGARYFSKIDLKNGYHLIRIKEGDEWKTAFRCRYGLFEYTVMPFGLINAPATFQAMINHIFRDMLDEGTIAFMDDISVYHATLEGHDTILFEVLKRLRDNGLCIAPEKCVWAQDRIEFLGYIVSGDGIEMTDEYIRAVKDIPPVQSLKDVQHFIGFANFYRRFIKNFSKVVLPLTKSTALSPVEWRPTPEIEEAQRRLVKLFTTAPVLKHFDPELQAIVETDASDFALGAILSQRHSDALHPVAFHSRKFSPAEINYDTADKELLAIVDCFKRWRRYLEGANHQVMVITDHNNLELFATTKVLNRRQARWAQELAGYDFKIFFRPGKQNVKADYLSRRPGDRPKEEGDGQQPQSILKESNLERTQQVAVAIGQPLTGLLSLRAPLPEVSSAGEGLRYIVSSARLLSLPPAPWAKEFLEDVRNAGKNDLQYCKGLEAASAGDPDGILSKDDGVLYRNGLLWVPKDLVRTVLESEHDSKVAGHFGQDKTIEIVRRNFWWPKMDSDIIGYIQSCLECQQDKSRRHRQYGLLSPLELPYAPWQSIAMDFITDLPESSMCTELWVVVDRFSKMAHFIPLSPGGKKAEDLARIFAREIWRLHGLPRDIVSDRDSRFTSDTWRVFLAALGVRPRMSTAFHPQTDGQTERTNQVIEAYLRSFVNKEQSDWVELLPMAEYAYNNSMTTATGLTPFYANYGFHPETTAPRRTEVKNPASLAYAHWMTGTIEQNRKALEATRERMSLHANKRRADNPTYRVGDLVMLSSRTIKTKRPSKKLDHKFHGPFQVERVVSPTAIRLTLPHKWKKHPTFHVSELEPFRAGTRPAPDPAKVLREADDIEADDEYDIEEVKGSTTRRGRVLYHVKWLGFPKKKDWTFEPLENFSEGGKQKILEFHQANPDAPRDYRLPKEPPQTPQQPHEPPAQG